MSGMREKLMELRNQVEEAWNLHDEKEWLLEELGKLVAATPVPHGERAWRVVNTDTEGPTGVAPVCEEPEHAEHLEASGLKGDGTGPHVFDCCPYPQLELWDEDAAAKTAVRFTELEATVAGT